MIILEGGSLSRADLITENQRESGFHPSLLTGAIPPSLASEVSNLSGRTSAFIPAEATPIYLQFFPIGTIRKWSHEPFEGRVEYAPVYHPSWDNPDGPGAA